MKSEHTLCEIQYRLGLKSTQLALTLFDHARPQLECGDAD